MKEKNKRNAKGQGCFVENKDGTFTYRKSAGKTADGRRKILVARGKSKQVCIQLMKEKEKLWEAGKKREAVSGKDSVATLCEKHLHFQIKNDELKPKSIDRREDTINNQIKNYPIGNLQVQALTSVDVEKHFTVLAATDLSKSTIVKALDVLNAAFNWAMARGEVSINPVAQIKATVVKRLSNREAKQAEDADVIVLSEEEKDAFLQESVRRNKWNGKFKFAGGLYGRFLLHSGLRVGEFIASKWKKYDAKNAFFTVEENMVRAKNRQENEETKYVNIVGSTKNKKARILKLSPEAVEDLKMIYEFRPGGPDDLICRTRNGKPYTATMVEHLVGTVFKALKFDDEVSGTHIFRRTFATDCKENGADTKEIAAYIGDLESTTSTYYIAARKKVRTGDKTTQVVPLPMKKSPHDI